MTAAKMIILPTSMASLIGRQKPIWVFNSIAHCSSSSSSTPPKQTRTLILYSKPTCCLCDGLKEKINAAFSLSGTPYPLHDWEKAYEFEIPVLAKLLADGTELFLFMYDAIFSAHLLLMGFDFELLLYVIIGAKKEDTFSTGIWDLITGNHCRFFPKKHEF
ncbi:hypothetical protein ACFE04_004982 [Oxalis oulophora]